MLTCIDKVNYDYQQRDEYLTEKMLGEFLGEFLPEYNIEYNKKVPNSKINSKPDYRIEELGLIIEFNGKFHFTNPTVILNDYKKRARYSDMGYVVKNIPYWIQLRNDVIYYIFEDVLDVEMDNLKDYNTYPLGFIDSKCPLPSTFCELGNKETVKEWYKWDKVIDKYYKYFDYTLIYKILKRDSFLEVANQTIMPYFRSFWESKGHGFGWEVSTDYFPGINREIQLLEQLDG